MPRSFIATDGAKQWVVGTCRQATLTNLAKMLASKKVITDFKIDRALSLDGGAINRVLVPWRGWKGDFGSRGQPGAKHHPVGSRGMIFKLRAQGMPLV